MPNFISEIQAASVSRSLNLNEATVMCRTFSASNRYNVFLSHKHDEVDLVKQIKSILESLHYQVYVDWEDATMPNRTNGQTASKLKAKIRSLDKFIFLASNGAINSKWCNWEIGYGDAYKLALDKFAIFPVSNQYGWMGTEYLSLYPRIEYASAYNDYNYGNPNFGTYWVVYPDGNKQTLKEWLSK